jgi:CRISPR system Cascade subunit CasB
MTAQDRTEVRPEQIARRWWDALQDVRRGDGTPNPTRDRASLAQLRRAATPLEAIEAPAVFDLYKRLGFGRADVERRLPRVAVVASVLAHVRKDSAPGDQPRRFAEMLGQGGERPVMSPLRFKRLLAATEDRDLLIAFRRAVALVGGKNIDVGDIAASLLDWSDRRRMRWAFDYYGAGFAAPKQDSTVSPDEED